MPAPVHYRVCSVGIACVVSLPLLAVFIFAFLPGDDAWRHVLSVLAGRYAINTLVVVLGTVAIATMLGTASAWVVSAYAFPGRAALAWMPLLPLAVPAYLAAYAYTDLLAYSGPLRTALRASMASPIDAWIPSVRNRLGLIVLLGVSLSPYVFVAARTVFESQRTYAQVIARTLGVGPLDSFWRVALPLAGPAIGGGGVLVAMEAAADYGAADYLAVDTLATGVFRSWLGLDSGVTAARLSLILLSGIGLLLLLTHNLRRLGGGEADGSVFSGRAPLRGLAASLAVVTASTPAVFGFLIPIISFVWLAIQPAAPSGGGIRTSELASQAINTATIAVLAGALAVCAALILAYTRRLDRSPIVTATTMAAGLGYAIPGTVIGLGLLAVLGRVDHGLQAFLGEPDSVRSAVRVTLTGSLIGLILGYQARFLGVALATLGPRLESVPIGLDDAARTLGAGPTRILLAVHAVRLRWPLLLAGLLVGVDAAKELPMTLMLRPFNFETLAVRAHQLAKDERLSEAAGSGLLLIAIGCFGVLGVGLASSSRGEPRDPARAASE